MSTVWKVLGGLALLAVLAVVAGSGLLDENPTLSETHTTPATPPATLDEHGENGPLPDDPSPPPHALEPSEGLTKREQQTLKARRIYLHAPLALGPIEIRAAGQRSKRPKLLIVHTAAPTSAARLALRAARYAYTDRSSYQITFRAKGKAPRPGQGPVATAAARAVRQAVEIKPGQGRTAISLVAVLDTRCKRATRKHRCQVETMEFLADRTTSTTNAHQRSYRVTVTREGGRLRATRITAAP